MKLEEEAFTTAGRIISKREASSKLVFYDILQNGSTLQAVATRRYFEGDNDEFAQINKTLHRGDIVKITGIPGKTNTGQMSVFITKEFELLSPCLHDLPLHTGLKDPEKRFRNRHLDFLVNREAVDILRNRAKIIQFIRQYFDSRSFLEVETPILSPKAGGAIARPFTTKANALGDLDMHLRIAPELYLKQLVIGGIDRVYEIGKQFRNEGIDADHNPEFTTCEFYQAYTNMEGLFKTTEDILSGIVFNIKNSHVVEMDGPDSEKIPISFKPPYRRIYIVDELENQLGTKLPPFRDESIEMYLDLCHKHNVPLSKPYTIPRILDKLVSHFIEPMCVQPTFLCGHPMIMSPLAKAIDKGSEITGRFELFVAGKEVVNAYEELNDPEDQRSRFSQQLKDRNSGDVESQLPDDAFCDALEYGLPPTGGWGMGIDRVCAMITGASHIRETLAFPTMKPITDEK
ncbi:lysyl-tRNA synthetase [Basidiobolus meristosporus CBS 931.73]|uniref:Lysine--tRNA ligase n=1 Tax=Basidiobolus meristosporus CBS 931.73 TaxID=1314790 RepID=A0A1Y1YVT2_9FUNG|nr:lysyl-tRNA synthetase [Basidiobolus meristosporus CBS 931.73]|eukprot:ORY02158.1 lysyl-tRNA synthetase [Basidiobolus meristosporus CBS 931.73]